MKNLNIFHRERNFFEVFIVMEHYTGSKWVFKAWLNYLSYSYLLSNVKSRRCYMKNQLSICDIPRDKYLMIMKLDRVYITVLQEYVVSLVNIKKNLEYLSCAGQLQRAKWSEFNFNWARTLVSVAIWSP
jgi:hypothetical protein